jgi:hypothetical protein
MAGYYNTQQNPYQQYGYIPQPMAPRYSPSTIDRLNRNNENCEKCPDKTKIYNPTSRRCVLRTSKQAMKLLASIDFCDKYFETKLSKNDSVFLKFLLDIPLKFLPTDNNNQYYKVSYFINRKNLTVTTVTFLAVIGFLLVFISDIPEFREDLKNRLHKWGLNREKTSSFFALLMALIPASTYIPTATIRSTYNFVVALFDFSKKSDGINVKKLNNAIYNINNGFYANYFEPSNITEHNRDPIIHKIDNYNNLLKNIKIYLGQQGVKGDEFNLSLFGLNSLEYRNNISKIKISNNSNIERAMVYITCKNKSIPDDYSLVNYLNSLNLNEIKNKLNNLLENLIKIIDKKILENENKRKKIDDQNEFIKKEFMIQELQNELDSAKSNIKKSKLKDKINLLKKRNLEIKRNENIDLSEEDNIIKCLVSLEKIKENNITYLKQRIDRIRKSNIISDPFKIKGIIKKLNNLVSNETLYSSTLEELPTEGAKNYTQAVHTLDIMQRGINKSPSTKSPTKVITPNTKSPTTKKSSTETKTDIYKELLNEFVQPKKSSPKITVKDTLGRVISDTQVQLYKQLYNANVKKLNDANLKSKDPKDRQVQYQRFSEHAKRGELFDERNMTFIPKIRKSD